jgi:hypothetical protein
MKLVVICFISKLSPETPTPNVQEGFVVEPRAALEKFKWLPK